MGTEFYRTRDAANARGIAQALREAICFEWGWMHQKRREAAQLTGDAVEDNWRRRCAGDAEARLRRLLTIRRDGLS